MKKLLTLTAAGALLTAPAMAVQKCVALNSSDTTCTYVNTGYNTVDWTSTCTTNGTSVPIKGIGVCAANAGSANGETADELTLDSDTSTLKYCWCKMTSPAVSSWVFLNALSSAGTCAASCAYRCAYIFPNNSAFRSALFSTMSD